MRNTQEVEKRAILLPKQYKSLIAQIEKKGARLAGTSTIIDVYMCPKAAKSFKDVEMDKVGSYSLRLREECINGKVQRTLNTKTITSYGDHNSWEEREVHISSVKDAGLILNRIGFKPFCIIKKKRKMFKLNELNVLIDDTKGFGLAIEAEILTSRRDSEHAKNRIDEFFSEIGIKKSQIVKKSVTNLIMRKVARF